MEFCNNIKQPTQKGAETGTSKSLEIKEQGKKQPWNEKHRMHVSITYLFTFCLLCVKSTWQQICPRKHRQQQQKL